jgi:hypothetical protein
LLLVDDGVIVALNPVIAVNEALVVVNVLVFAVLIVCKTRNAPRKLFICVLVKTCPVVKLAGSVVGVAIVLVYAKTGCGSCISSFP